MYPPASRAVCNPPKIFVKEKLIKVVDSFIYLRNWKPGHRSTMAISKVDTSIWWFEITHFVPL